MKNKNPKKYIDSGMEDWMDISKIWGNREKLSKIDPSKLEFREHQILAQT